MDKFRQVWSLWLKAKLWANLRKPPLTSPFAKHQILCPQSSDKNMKRYRLMSPMPGTENLTNL